MGINYDKSQREAIYKAINKAGAVTEFAHLSPADTVTWAERQALAAKKKIRFLGNVEEGPRSVIVFSDGDDVSVAYCGKTAKHYQKLFEENSSVEF